MARQNSHARKSGNNLQRGHVGMIMATAAQQSAVRENRRLLSKIYRYQHSQVPGAEANLNRLLTLKRDLCCYPDCPRKHIYWTPRGKFCGFHRDEALKAMAAAKRARYGA